MSIANFYQNGVMYIPKDVSESETMKTLTIQNNQSHSVSHSVDDSGNYNVVNSSNQKLMGFDSSANLTNDSQLYNNIFGTVNELNTTALSLIQNNANNITTLQNTVQEMQNTGGAPQGISSVLTVSNDASNKSILNLGNVSSNELTLLDTLGNWSIQTDGTGQNLNITPVQQYGTVNFLNGGNLNVSSGGSISTTALTTGNIFSSGQIVVNNYNNTGYLMIADSGQNSGNGHIYCTGSSVGNSSILNYKSCSFQNTAHQFATIGIDSSGNLQSQNILNMTGQDILNIGSIYSLVSTITTLQSQITTLQNYITNLRTFFGVFNQSATIVNQETNQPFDFSNLQ